MSQRHDLEHQSKGKFASFALHVFSVQRFYNSTHKPRDTWLEKYTYRTVDEIECGEQRSLMSPPSTLSAQEKVSDLQDVDTNNQFARSSKPEKTLENLPLAFNPCGVGYFFWLFIVSLGVVYNYWVLVLRLGFPAIEERHLFYVLGLDYLFDLVFVLDILIQCRTGFLRNGELVLIPNQLRKHYTHSLGFILDCLSVLPLDFLYFAVGINPLLRLGKLLKWHRFFLFCERGEIYSGRPKLFNLVKLLHYLFLIIHWVACLYFIVSRSEGFGSDKWVHPKLEEEWAEVKLQYVYCFYRSSVSLTTVGSGVTPRTLSSLVFVIVTYLCGVLIFATIVGNASDMIVDFRRSREQYLRRVDGMKAYIAAHQLPAYLQHRVIKWFDYLWTYKKDTGGEELFHQMNDRIKADIAIHVHLDTLKKVKMFEECDPGFLRELVLKLKPQLCSPGDYVCRKDEVGHDMYIVNKGRLEVLDDHGNTLCTLSAGKHFGIGNRRTASVRSVGFSDLFQLSKNDLEEVLQYYPDAKEQLEKIATDTFERQKRERMEIAGETGDEDDSNGEQGTSDSSTKNRLSVSHSDDDPRKWFFADGKELRRRLSDVEARLEVRKLANKFKRENNVKDPRAIVAEFTKNVVREKTSDDTRTLIQEFLDNKRRSKEFKTTRRTKSVKAKVSPRLFLPTKRRRSAPECKFEPTVNFKPVSVLDEKKGTYHLTDIMMIVDGMQAGENKSIPKQHVSASNTIVLPKVVISSEENDLVIENNYQMEYCRPRAKTIATPSILNILKRRERSASFSCDYPGRLGRGKDVPKLEGRKPLNQKLKGATNDKLVEKLTMLSTETLESSANKTASQGIEKVQSESPWVRNVRHFDHIRRLRGCAPTIHDASQALNSRDRTNRELSPLRTSHTPRVYIQSGQRPKIDWTGSETTSQHDSMFLAVENTQKFGRCCTNATSSLLNSCTKSVPSMGGDDIRSSVMYRPRAFSDLSDTIRSNNRKRKDYNESAV